MTADGAKRPEASAPASHSATAIPPWGCGLSLQEKWLEASRERTALAPRRLCFAQASGMLSLCSVARAHDMNSNRSSVCRMNRWMLPRCSPDLFVCVDYGHQFSYSHVAGSCAGTHLLTDSQEAVHVLDQRRHLWQFLRQDHARVLPAQPAQAAPPAAHPMFHSAH